MSDTRALERAKVPCNKISCSLSPEDLKDQRGELIPGLFHRSEKVEEIKNGFRFLFSHQPRLLTELAELIERERICCSFLRFVLTVDGNIGSVSLEVSGPSGTVELLKSL